MSHLICSINTAPINLKLFGKYEILSGPFTGEHSDKEGLKHYEIYFKDEHSTVI